MGTRATVYHPSGSERSRWHAKPVAPDDAVVVRAAIYARVSTLTGQSPQMQLDVLYEYAERRQLEVVDEFVDHGVSGARDRRPELDRLMNGARQRAFDMVLVYRFDRFARGVRHLVGALDEFDALDIQFVSYSESLDTSTPMGRAMFSIIGALAELERNVVLERSIEGQRRARARGAHVGRPRRTVDEAQVVQLRAAGASVRSVARTMGVSRSVVERVERERRQAA
jgi:DNA invertase Pin-like site-specific DNA recombinase